MLCDFSIVKKRNELFNKITRMDNLFCEIDDFALMVAETHEG